MKNKLAIFDLDGTLFDTNEVNYYSYKDALKSFGYELDYKYFMEDCCGRYFKDFLSKIVSTEEEISKVHAFKKKKYPLYLQYARVNMHLFQIIQNLAEDYYIALVTTASRNNCMDILEYYQKESCFDLILTQEDVEFVKPSPEGFIKAMEYFGVSKEQTIIFEDSETGLKAAARSGAMVIKIHQWNDVSHT